jgi:hypothetical protein
MTNVQGLMTNPAANAQAAAAMAIEARVIA